jgi:hypothetical protein
VDLLQTWLIIGVPGLIVAAGLFTGRSLLRAWLGYAVLATLVGVFLFIPGDVISAAAIGLIIFMLVAAGRGMQADTGPNHHQTRRRFTTAAHD